MAELKTKKNDASVSAFLNSVEGDVKRKDAKAIAKMMREATGSKGKMWGTSIVGFGTRTLTNAKGKESEWMAIGFSPRKTSLVLYIMDGFKEYQPLLKKLGKHKTGKSCLYVDKLADVDLAVLKQMIAASVAHSDSK